MTYAGAIGKTQKEMAKVLHFSTQPYSSFSKLQSNFDAIQNKGYVKLSVANSLWVQNGYHFLDSFLELNQKYYSAGLNFVDFALKTETARKTINTWVENKTQQKIKELIKPSMFDSSTKLVLCNAIYFKGSWLNSFDKKRTVDADFYTSPNKTIKVSMMNQNAKFRFKDFGNFSAIELPCKGGDLSMIIFLPKKINGLKRFEKKLTNNNVKYWINRLSNSHKEKVQLSLPKFKTTNEFELSDILGSMGMKSAFSSLADFSGMTGKKDLFIGKVIHKAFVDVSEKGTEAAGATAVTMLLKCAMIEEKKPLIFKADHPFVFLILENSTGTILFVGRIANPLK